MTKSLPGWLGLRQKMSEHLAQTKVESQINFMAEQVVSDWAQACDPPLVQLRAQKMDAGITLFRAECVRLTKDSITEVMLEHPVFFASSRELANTYRRLEGALVKCTMVSAMTKRSTVWVAAHVRRISHIILGLEPNRDGMKTKVAELLPPANLEGVDGKTWDQWVSRWIVPEVIRRATSQPEAWIATPDWLEVTVPVPLRDLLMELTPLEAVPP